MSASSQSLPKVPASPCVFGELLHSLSQALATLRCSLELSLDHATEVVAEEQQASVSAALQQTEKVIGMIQLMREYLDAEQPRREAYWTELAPVVQNVIEELSSIAAVRGIELRLVGTCTGSLPVPEERLRLALQYLIAAKIEVQPAGGRVTLLLGDGPGGAGLRVKGARSAREGEQGATSPRTTGGSAGTASTLRSVRLAIGSTVLATAVAALVFCSVDLI